MKYIFSLMNVTISIFCFFLFSTGCQPNIKPFIGVVEKAEVIPGIVEYKENNFFQLQVIYNKFKDNKPSVERIKMVHWYYLYKLQKDPNTKIDYSVILDYEFKKGNVMRIHPEKIRGKNIFIIWSPECINIIDRI